MTVPVIIFVAAIFSILAILEETWNTSHKTHQED